MSPNSNDVARLAGVSQATVSRVLSGHANVRDDTRRRVLEAIACLNFQPNAFARSMKTRMSGIVGVCVSRITNPIVPELLLRLAAELTGCGRRMVVWNTDTEGEDGVVTAIRQRAIDGVLFTAAGQKSHAIKVAVERNMPVVCINRHVAGGRFHQFVGANVVGGRAIGDYLVNAGRRRVALINGPLDRSTLADREKGLLAALGAAGQRPSERYRARSDFSHEAFRQLAIDMMTKPSPPDAIACGNDVIALAVLCGLKSIGCRVPEDVWVTGFDGIEMAGWDVFDITTMVQPLDKMASAAVRALIGHIENGLDTPKLVKFETRLVVRGTTAHAPDTQQ